MTRLINLTAQRFGRLTVLERAPSDRWGRTRWICRCECGNHTRVLAHLLRRGDTTSCGCRVREGNAGALRAYEERRRTEKEQEMVGRRFERLTVTGLERTARHLNWLVRCDCGNTTRASRYALEKGLVKSCGCLRRERFAQHINGRRKGHRAPSAVGERFGSLVVTDRLEDGPNKNQRFRCRCDCGGKKVVWGSDLRRGTRRSCGCGQLPPLAQSWRDLVMHRPAPLYDRRERRAA